MPDDPWAVVATKPVSAPPPMATSADDPWAVVSHQPAPEANKPEGFLHSLGSVFGLTPEAYQAAKQKAANMNPLQEALAATKPPNPVDVAKSAGKAVASEFSKGSQEGKESYDALQQGDIKGFLAHQIGQVGHAGATLAAPVMGENLSKAGEQFGEGNIKGGLGTATGLIAPVVAGGVARGEKSVPRSALSKTIKPENPVEFHVAEQSAIPKVNAAAQDLGQPIKTADDAIAAIRQAKQNALLEAHEAAGPGKTISDLPPDKLKALQDDMGALDTLDKHIKTAQEAAAETKPQPTRTEAAGQILKGGAKVAAGAAVDAVAPGLGHAAGVLGLFKGTPEVVSGVKNLLAKRALTAENLDLAVQQTFGKVDVAPRTLSPKPEAPAQATPYSGDLSVQHETNIAPPRHPHGEAIVTPDEEPAPPEQTKPPYEPYAGDRTVIGTGTEPPAPKPQPFKATTPEGQTAEVLKKAGVQQALKDAGVAAPSATVRQIRPGIDVGPTLSPRMDLTFYGDKTGEGASLMQLTRYNINELRAMAVQRGLDVSPAETHIQLIEKIHDDLSPAEIKEFSDAAAERGRFSPPAKTKRGTQPQTTTQPQAEEPPASAPATPPASLSEQARARFEAQRSAAQPQAAETPQVPTEATTEDLLQKSIAQAQAKRGAAQSVDTSKKTVNMETGTTMQGQYGADTEVKTPNGNLPSKYKVVEADSLIPSHDAQTFAKNPQYPEGVQERDYSRSKEAQNRVIQQAQNYDPAYTVNTNPDAVNGPPVVTKDGVVLGGNSRTMSTQRLYKSGSGDSYRADLAKNAAQFGVSPEQIAGMKQPVLVREVETPANIEEARRLGSDLNKNMTGAMGTGESAVSSGRSVKPETLSAISDMVNDMGEGATLRDALRQNGREVLAKLVNDGVISERDRPQFIDTATGGMNDEGKTFVERALVGSVVDDPRLMDTVPKSVLGKLEGSLGDLSQVGSRSDEYNLLPLVREALAEHSEIASRGLDVETHLAQSGMFGPERNPAVDALIRSLADKPKVFRAAIKQYAQDAKYDSQGQGSLAMGEKPSAAKSFNDAFGTNLSEDQFHDALLQSLKKEGTIGTSGQETANPPANGSLRENSTPAARPSPARGATENKPANQKAL